ncbi:EAL domain-containing protein [uncultured Desulfobacter sp.]|uniref:bifunctional diguanylate cyclase/phosphodiesterase n=1 Tax=uncultured Desulfobacter sp. TaxID=240139 RepID=UPI0029F53E8A|nr:EAL domain-containing protein [uncultured Desulfobacter sp.]
MSLLKQTQLLVTFLLTATLIIVLRINFNTAREFTANESYLNTKNNANMLALTLSAGPMDEDLMKTSINAMFDGGYFESISLVRQDGTLVYEKREPVAIHGVPAFFITHIDLVIPEVEAKVMNGWNIFGSLKIKGHPGSSYTKLWETLVQLCLQFCVLGILVLFISILGLRHLLGALEKIKHQAEAISNNDFILNQEIPGTPELKKVVLAMNTMVKKVQSIYEHNLENLSKYQKLRYQDKITGLHNRASFIKQFAEMIGDKHPKAVGHVVILSLTGVEEIEASGNRPLVQKIFKEMADVLDSRTKFAVSQAEVYRFPRREFAAILPDTQANEVMKLVDAVITKFLSQKDKDIPETLKVYAGISPYDKNDDVGMVLSKADYALSEAKIGRSGAVKIFKDESFQKALGKQEWKTLIDVAFSKNHFFLTAQPVRSDSREFHREVFVNMVDQEGVQRKANLFIPMITTLGLASKLDRYIIEESAAFLGQNQESVLSVNITTEFCRDHLAVAWLRQFLSDKKNLAGHLLFEVHENTLINFPEICLDFAGLISGKGFKLGIDRFTMHDLSLKLLDKIKPYYIKIERDYLEVFDDPQKADMVLNSLFTITQSLSIKLIATKIENQTQRRELADKNIIYFQGHGIAQVVPLRG